MSENPDRVPDTLSTTTPIKRRPDGLEPRQRRPRSNVRGPRANTLPPVKRGQPVSRIVPDNKTIREWARRRKYDVSDRGKIPDKIREEFAEWLKVNGNGAWNVTVVSLRPPGAKEYAQYFQVRQGSVLVKQTTDPFYVLRKLGPEVYPLLTVPPKKRSKK